MGLAKAMPFLGFASYRFFHLTHVGVNSPAQKRKNPPHFHAKGIAFAVWTGLEPATPCVTGRYSNQLNYQTVFSAISDYRYSGIRKTCALLRDNKSTCFFEFCKTKRKVSRKICKRWLDYLWVQFPSLVGYVYRAFKMRY